MALPKASPNVPSGSTSSGYDFGNRKYVASFHDPPQCTPASQHEALPDLKLNKRPKPKIQKPNSRETEDPKRQTQGPSIGRDLVEALPKIFQCPEPPQQRSKRVL